MSLLSDDCLLRVLDAMALLIYLRYLDHQPLIQRVKSEAAHYSCIFSHYIQYFAIDMPDLHTYVDIYVLTCIHALTI